MADVLTNRASLTLAAAITSATQTSITRTSATDGLPGDSNGPASGTYVISLTDGTNWELARVTGGQGTTTLTIARAVELIGGTQTALASVASGTVCYAVATAGDLVSNPMTALNDLIVGGASGAPTRLGVGTPGQVLTVLGSSSAVLFSPGGDAGAYINSPYIAPAVATASFMLWVLPPSGYNLSSNPELFGTSSFYGTAGLGLGYALGAGGTTPGGFNFAMNASAAYNATDPTTTPPAGIWRLYVGTYDGTTMLLYANGAQVATTAATGSVVASTQGLAVGSSPSLAAGRFWNSQLAHAAYFPGVVLTATQASDLYSNASSMDEASYESYVVGLGPAIYYPMQEQSGASATNKGSTGSTDDGTYTDSGGGTFTLGETPGPITGGVTRLAWV